MAPKRRPSWFEVETALPEAGELLDTKPGRRKYMQYLGWLAESDEYKEKVLEQQSEILQNRSSASSGRELAQERWWWAHAEALLEKLEKSVEDLAREGK
jgi:hypothetical protein